MAPGLAAKLDSLRTEREMTLLRDQLTAAADELDQALGPKPPRGRNTPLTAACARGIEQAPRTPCARVAGKGQWSVCSRPDLWHAGASSCSSRTRTRLRARQLRNGQRDRQTQPVTFRTLPASPPPSPSNRWGVLVVDKTRTRPLAAIHGSGLGVNAEMRQEGLWGLL